MNGEQIRYRTWQKKSDRRQYIKEWQEMISKSKHKFDIQIKIIDMGKTLIRIGIDPDLKASGFCVLVKQPFGTWQIQVIDTIPFFTLIEQIEAEYTASKATGNDLTVCIEAGWLNKSIHHFAENKAIAGRIGKNVGHNEAIGELIAEYCERNNINYNLIVTGKQIGRAHV